MANLAFDAVSADGCGALSFPSELFRESGHPESLFLEEAISIDAHQDADRFRSGC
jgi:hypothetical protein